MSTRKTTLFYGSLIAVSSLAVGMVIASRLDLSPASSAQSLTLLSLMVLHARRQHRLQIADSSES